MAADLVWPQRLFPLARIQSLQDARASLALALPLLYDLSRLQRSTLPTGGPVVQGSGFGVEDSELGKCRSPTFSFADVGRFLSTAHPRRLEIHRRIRRWRAISRESSVAHRAR